MKMYVWEIVFVVYGIDGFGSKIGSTGMNIVAPNIEYAMDAARNKILDKLASQGWRPDRWEIVEARRTVEVS